MTPAIVHLTHTLTDHTMAETLCGMKLRTNHVAVREAQTGTWVSCPLCEAAFALEGLMPDISPRSDRSGWTQPTFKGMENHD